ncbi:MFS transporter [Pendulispora rubella]|uniref:MFS transporter n=1 Tax=Pendulispora rubella TaxID=2741070 RepID=A0ABZ2KWL9_9BACT
MQDADAIRNIGAREKTGAQVSPAGIGQQLGAFALTVGRYRWTICFILFLAATINYVDRQVIGVLKPDLTKLYGWSEKDYGNIVFWFQVAYAMGMLSMGWLMDKVGTKIGFAIAATIWGLAATGHVLATSVVGFKMARFGLGIGEAGMFPAAVKVIAHWFPKRERAFAMGLFNSGTNVGAIVTPLMLPMIVPAFGIGASFVVTGILALLWAGLWLAKYHPPEEHPKISETEMAWIKSDPVPNYPKIPWVRLLPWRQTWAFAIGKFLIDPIWWLYLFWVPSLLNQKYGLTLNKIGLPLVTIYLISDVGSIFGGWLSSTFIRRGWTINRSRKVAMILCACLVPPIVFAANVGSTWTAVLLIGLATAGHQGFSANLFTLTSDLFPTKAVGSVVGFGGMGGAIGGIFIAQLAGTVLQAMGPSGYYVLLLLPPMAYTLAIVSIHLLSPRLEPIRSEELPSGS